jgi:hypothetical protein
MQNESIIKGIKTEFNRMWTERSTSPHGRIDYPYFSFELNGLNLDEWLQSLHPNQLDLYRILYPVFFTFLLIFIPLGGLDADIVSMEAIV